MRLLDPSRLAQVVPCSRAQNPPNPLKVTLKLEAQLNLVAGFERRD